MIKIFSLAGYYMFTEASWPRKPNHNAILHTDKMQSDGEDRCIDFYYHMYGTGIGSLIVTVEYGGTKVQIFKKTGSQFNRWYRGQGTLRVPAGNDFKVSRNVLFHSLLHLGNDCSDYLSLYPIICIPLLY